MNLALKTGLTLYFARHGETRANVEHRFSGWKETPLTERGRAQASGVGLILKRELGAAPGYAFVSSPLARATASMALARAAMGLEPQDFTTDERLREIDLGDWDQLTDAEARARDPALFAARGNDKWHVRVPGGENYAEVAARISGWLRDLSGNTIAISHGATTRILRGLLGGLDWRAMSALDEPQGVVFRVRGSETAKLEP
jgi:probable phosphoglycerate mutase